MLESYESELLEIISDAFDKTQKAIDEIDKLLKKLETAFDSENFKDSSVDIMIRELKDLKVKMLERFDRDSRFLQEYSERMNPERLGIDSYPKGQICMIVNPVAQIARECAMLADETLEENMYVNPDNFSVVEAEDLYRALDDYNRSSVLVAQAYEQLSDNLHSAARIFEDCETSAADTIKLKETSDSTGDTRSKIAEGIDCFFNEIYDSEAYDAVGSLIREKSEEQDLYPVRFNKRPVPKVDHVPPPTTDSVRFSAISPKKVTAGKYMPINIVMYEDKYRSAVDEIVSTYEEPAKESKSGYHDVERNSVIKVVLSSADVHIEDDTEEEIWNGKYINFEFAVKIPSDIIEEQILLTASVYINDVPATKLKLIVDCNAKPKQNITVSRKDISSAFVSYASQDRTIVTAYVHAMEAVRPDMKIFFDVDSLRDGQLWNNELMKEIDNCDTLFLCWSPFAKESEWVDKEWRYALETKGDDSIEPMSVVPPEKCPPPPELQHKHFNNRLLYIIEATKK